MATPPAFDRCYSACRYAHPVDHLINQFKFFDDLTSGTLLTNILGEYLSNHADMPDTIVAVPLHWRRHWQRGFNQAQFLADQLSHQLNIKTMAGISRQKHTTKQQGLDRRERLRNLRQAFNIKGAFEGLHIAVVDDVVTTATTANTIATLLKKASASRVDIWSIARTPAPSK
ncbi:ComF family protein [Aurantivibrio plasticivorans]